MSILVNNIVQEVSRHPDYTLYGRVSAVVGLLVEVAGLKSALSVGDHCRIVGRAGRAVTCEVVGFRDLQALVMPFGNLDGVGLGCRVEVGTAEPLIRPHTAWAGPGAQRLRRAGGWPRAAAERSRCLSHPPPAAAGSRPAPGRRQA